MRPGVSTRAGAGLIVAAAMLAAACGTSAEPGGLVNFSGRAGVAGDTQVLTLGLAVEGTGNSYVLRGLGPALARFGVAHAVGDPVLSLYRGPTLLNRNDNWGGGFLAPAHGAFPLPAGSLDAAMWVALEPGAYTAQLTAATGAAGTGMIELYDTRTGSGRLANVSIRASAGAGDAALVAGFAVAGTGDRQVLLRAIGPSLAGFGVDGVLAQPRLELYHTGAAGVVGTSDRPGNPVIHQLASAQTGAFPLNAGSRDATLLLTLEPGVYTVRVSGPAAAAAGAVLLELYDRPVSIWPLLSQHNVLYEHGDILNFDARGTYYRPDGSRSVVTNGWLRLSIVDQGLRNPLGQDSPVLTLVESLMYEGYLATPDGRIFPVRYVPPDAIRGFVQDDPTGTIKYQADIVAESFDTSGAPVYTTYWFHSPRNYSQYTLPLAVGDTRVVDYDRRSIDGAKRVLGHVTTQVHAIDTVSTPLGRFDAYRMSILARIESDGVAQLVNNGVQYISPMLGAVGFEFYSLVPGETGSLAQWLAETNLPFDGRPLHPLDAGNRLLRPTAGHELTYRRSGFYITDDNTVEDLAGSRTVRFVNEEVLHPVTRQRVLTALETNVTETTATTLAGVTTRSTRREVARHFLAVTADGEAAVVGEADGDGPPQWYEAGYVPLNFPYRPGQSRTVAVVAHTYGADGRPTPAFSARRTFRVAATARTTTAPGVFECYRIVVTDTRAPTVDHYVYPALGVVRYRHEAPTGRRGSMNLTLSATNLPLN